MKIAHAAAVALALVACSKKDADDNKQPPQPPTPSPVPKPGPACGEQVAKLKTWLGDLAADGVTPWLATGVKLVTLPDEAIKPFDRTAPVITFGTNEIVMEGTLLATTGSDPIAIKDQLLDRLQKKSANDGAEIVVLVDQATPWKMLVPAMAAAAQNDRTRVTFAFVAGKPGRATTPPPSKIDADFAALEAGAKAADLAGDKPGLPAKVFADCKPVLDWMSTLSDSGMIERATKIVDGLPKAIEACGCNVEIASVQRLMWAWFMRDSGTAFTWFTVELATDKGGTEVTAKKDAPWSETHATVLAAAKQGKPLAFK
jgi:hypothetical protein